MICALVATAFVLTGLSPAEAADGGHGVGRMGARMAPTTTVSPTAGPDFELPFLCGQAWTGTTRSTHSPSPYTIDFNSANDRGKPALASAPGVVTKTVTLTGSYGRYVVIDHGGGYTTLYAHLDKFMTTVGSFVDQGDLIGYVGASGAVTGAHLHFEERKDGAYFPPYFHRTPFSFGSTVASANCTDRPVTGDWDGDKVTDVAVYRTSPSKGEYRQLVGEQVVAFPWGWPGDMPVVGNWGGDRKDEVAIRRQGTATFLLRSETAQMTTLNGLGYPTDRPLAGDWDGNGISDLALYRPTTKQFWLRSPTGAWTAVTWGATGDVPIAGDWNGDGRTDIGTWNSMTGIWTLRVPSGSSYTTRLVRYGVLGDLPVTGDWDGDGITDLGAWRSSTAMFWMRTPAPTGFVNKTLVYGEPR